jgi:cell division control protein 6
MVQRGLTNFFESFLQKESLFKEKKVIQSNYTPDVIPHRDKEIGLVANILAPCLRLERPSNIFIYGKTGTGKTLSAIYTTNQILEVAKPKGIPIKVIYVNCKMRRVADTEYRLITSILNEFGVKVPSTGLPTEDIYNVLIKKIESEKMILILVLDEIDQLVKKAGDGVIYNMTRLNEQLADVQIAIIGISNDLMFIDNIDPRVRSSLSEEEIIFPPYNAIQLKNILNNRVKRAFKEGVLEQGLVEKCAAYAAREHGDARRALELLRVAGEIAERGSEEMVKIEHLDQAEQKIERDRVVDIVTTQPKQQQAALYSIFLLGQKTKSSLYTGDVYSLYKEICSKCGLRPLTQRRLSDIIGELDMLGIINAKVISKGRFGRTREINVAIPHLIQKNVTKILEQNLDLR